MRTSATGAALFAVLVVLAGCTGGATLPADGGTSDGETTDAPGVDAADTPRDTDGGAVNFWISDEPNDIDDFEHLNVTVTKVAFHRVDGDAAAGEDDRGDGTDRTEDGENGTDDGEETTVETEAPGDEDDGTEAGNESDEAENGDGDDEAEDEDRDDDDGEAEDEDDDEGENGRWIERDVDGRTVDLTRLKGNNATLLGAFDVPEGEYDKVFVYVDGIDATLTNGESTRVKLPSGRLHLNKGFAVTENESPDFVFDIAVHRAGNSGKYILKPVVSESGTDVPIEDADDGERGPPENPGNGNGNGPPDDAGNGNGNGNGPPDDPGNGNGPPDDPGNGNGNGPPDNRIAPADADRRVPVAVEVAR